MKYELDATRKWLGADVASESRRDGAFERFVVQERLDVPEHAEGATITAPKKLKRPLVNSQVAN